MRESNDAARKKYVDSARASMRARIARRSCAQSLPLCAKSGAIRAG
jgi:hypothetical protein